MDDYLNNHNHLNHFDNNWYILNNIVVSHMSCQCSYLYSMVRGCINQNIKIIKDEIETSFGDYFWQDPVTAKELLVLFMYSDNIYNADTMRHKIKEIDGVAFTEVFFPKKITMPTDWITNAIKNASRSEKLHVPIKQII